jgi:hypothetical protein
MMMMGWDGWASIKLLLELAPLMIHRKSWHDSDPHPQRALGSSPSPKWFGLRFSV